MSNFVNEKNINRALRVVGGEKVKDVAKSEGVGTSAISYTALAMCQIATKKLAYIETMKQAKENAPEVTQALKELKERIKKL